MRIRTIKPEFFKDDKLAECSPFARLLFAGLWCMADRRGRLEDRPKRIKAELLPYDSADIDALLNELCAGGFVARYDGGKFGPLLQVLKFEEHQRITGKEAETESEYPNYTGETLGKQRGNNGETTETTGMEGNGRERNGKEGSGVEGNSHAQPSAPPPKTAEVNHGDTPEVTEPPAVPGNIGALVLGLADKLSVKPTELKPPQMSDVIAAAEIAGGTAADGREFFEFWQNQNWLDRDCKPIHHRWRNKLKSRIEELKSPFSRQTYRDNPTGRF